MSETIGSLGNQSNNENKFWQELSQEYCELANNRLGEIA